jgi:hypothetical protein
MGSHEHERLSAYLDGELAAAERAEVAAHVGACAECAARLTELAAVDEAAAALGAEAPAGYFDTLPTRVRARLAPDGRLSAQDTPRRPARGRLPAWTWAAAAALVLAVVTPLVLRQRPDLPGGGTAGEPAAVPLEARPVTARAPAPAAPAAQATPLALAEAEVPAAAVPAAGELIADATSPGAAPGATTAGAPAREPAAAGYSRGPESDAPAPPPSLPATAPEPKKRETAFAAAPSQAEPSAVPALTAKAVEREGAAVALRDEAAEAGAAADARNQAQARADERPAEEALAASAESPAARPAPARGRVAGPAAGALASPRTVLLAEWEQLEAARPATAAEWRRLRESWQRTAARDPDGKRADEARVRAIEAARGAWRASGDPADEAQLRGDVAAYLKRADAAQKERVSSLLR